MQVPKYTSSQEIINKVYRDTGSQHVFNQEDLIEWIFEALNMLGTNMTLVPRHTGPLENSDYNFENYRVPLPCDFAKLVQVSMNGYPAIPSTNSFHHLLDGGCCTETNPAVLNTFVDNFGNTFNNQIIGPVVGYGNINPQATFDINEDYITFNSKTGTCCLAYYAYPIDKNGFPLIPDETKVKEAITKALIMRLDYIGWRTGQIKQEVYMDSKQEYEWYIASARGHLKTPDLAQMESIKNQMIRLRPNNDQYSTFFRNLGCNVTHRN